LGSGVSNGPGSANKVELGSSSEEGVGLEVAVGGDADSPMATWSAGEKSDGFTGFLLPKSRFMIEHSMLGKYETRVWDWKFEMSPRLLGVTAFIYAPVSSYVISEQGDWR